MFAKDYRDRARLAMQGKWNNLAVIALVYSVILSAVSAISSKIGGAATLIVGGPFALSWAVISLGTVRGASYKVENLFDGFKNFMPAFLLYLLNTLFVALWSLLFVVPGIVKSLAYSMSYFILAENPNMDQADVRRTSEAMMDGHKWRLFCLNFSFIGWYILSTLTCGILFLWVIPYVQAANAAFFEDVRAQYIARQQAASPAAAEAQDFSTAEN